MSPRRLLLPLLVYAGILGMSSIPGSTLNDLGWPEVASYLGHAIEYAALGAALRWALEAMVRRRPELVAVLVGVLLGGLDELYQSTVPGRSPSLVDVAVDVTAVAVAALIVGRRLRRPLPTPGSG